MVGPMWFTAGWSDRNAVQWDCEVDMAAGGASMRADRCEAPSWVKIQRRSPGHTTAARYSSHVHQKLNPRSNPGWMKWLGHSFSTALKVSGTFVRTGQ